MLDTETGELAEKRLEHEGEKVQELYSALPGLVLVGIEATGSMSWFLKLMEKLKIEYRVSHPVGPVTALATEVFFGDPTGFTDEKAVSS